MLWRAWIKIHCEQLNAKVPDVFLLIHLHVMWTPLPPPQEVIPILKANMAAICDPSLLEQIQRTVLDLVLKHEKERVRNLSCVARTVLAHCVSITESWTLRDAHKADWYHSHRDFGEISRQEVSDSCMVLFVMLYPTVLNCFVPQF